MTYIPRDDQFGEETSDCQKWGEGTELHVIPEEQKVINHNGHGSENGETNTGSLQYWLVQRDP